MSWVRVPPEVLFSFSMEDELFRLVVFIYLFIRSKIFHVSTQLGVGTSLVI